MVKEKFLNLLRKYSDNGGYNLGCWKEIEKFYSSHNRHYHNLEHLKNMLEELNPVESEVKNLDTLLFSIYYHDIIYIPTRSDNEQQSALSFKERISETSFANIFECMAQIEATKEHKLSADNDTNILLDLDLSILGKSPGEYNEYSENIRKEYSMFSNSEYRKGRIKVLKHLLELESIYKTDFFKNEYESQAKENINLELEELNQ